jgi:class 3 adenylate cyclase
MKKEVASIYQASAELKSQRESERERLSFASWRNHLDNEMRDLKRDLQLFQASFQSSERLLIEKSQQIAEWHPELRCLKSRQRLMIDFEDCGRPWIRAGSLWFTLNYDEYFSDLQSFGFSPRSRLALVKKLSSDSQEDSQVVKLERVWQENEWPFSKWKPSESDSLFWDEGVEHKIQVENDVHYQLSSLPLQDRLFVLVSTPVRDRWAGGEADHRLASYLDNFISTQSEVMNHQMKVSTILNIFLIMLGTFVASVWVSSRISRSVTRVKEKAEQIVKGDFETKIEIQSRDEFGDLARSLNQMMEGLKERVMMKDTLGRAVSPQVLEAIMQLDQKPFLTGENVEVSLLVGDFRGFTSASERMKPHELIGFLNSYFSRFVDVIFKYGGTLDKYLGDGIMVVFGAPVHQKDHADRAIKAAVEILSIVDQFNEERLADKRDLLNYGIGVNSGRVVAGRIGTKDRFDYTVIGDQVNLAFRTQEYCKEMHRRLLITENTRGSLQGQEPDLHYTGTVTARGRKEPVKLYAVNETQVAKRIEPDPEPESAPESA